MRKALLIWTLLLGALVPCWAGPVFSDSLTVRKGIAGPILYQLTLFEDGSFTGGSCSGALCGVAEDPGNIYYIADSTIIDPAEFGNATVLTELDGTNSDIFGIATIGGPLYLAFSSDGDPGGVNFGIFPRTFPEGNGVWDATMYLSPTLRMLDYHATFISDAVPEPSTLVLFGTAGLALLGYGWRRKRA